MFHSRGIAQPSVLFERNGFSKIDNQDGGLPREWTAGTTLQPCPTCPGGYRPGSRIHDGASEAMASGSQAAGECEEHTRWAVSRAWDWSLQWLLRFWLSSLALVFYRNDAKVRYWMNTGLCSGSFSLINPSLGHSYVAWCLLCFAAHYYQLISFSLNKRCLLYLQEAFTFFNNTVARGPPLNVHSSCFPTAQSLQYFRLCECHEKCHQIRIFYLTMHHNVSPNVLVNATRPLEYLVACHIELRSGSSVIPGDWPC